MYGSPLRIARPLDVLIPNPSHIQFIVHTQATKLVFVNGQSEAGSVRDGAGSVLNLVAIVVKYVTVDRIMFRSVEVGNYLSDVDPA